MSENLSELKAKTDALNLTVIPAGKKLGKADYIRELRAHYLKQEFGDGQLPYEEVEPMKCFAIWNMTEAEAEEAWTSPNWVAQEKLNGCRLILHFVRGVGVFAHSRTVSEQTYRYTDLTGALTFNEFVPDFDATVDSEAYVDKPIDTRPFTGGAGCVTKTSLHSTSAIFHLKADSARRLQIEQDAYLTFKTFDIIRLNGKDLRSKKLDMRITDLVTFRGLIEQTPIGKYFEFPEMMIENKKAYYESILARGGEGVILKNLFSPYVATSSRLRDGWVKVKKGIEFDAFVTGIIRGLPETAWKNLVGALEFSVILDNGKEHHLGCASNMTLEFRKEISVYDEATDTVSLRPDMFGKVAQISGQDVSARSLRLSHCTIDRWRDQAGDQKRKEDCVVPAADLRKAAEWVG